VERSPIAVTGLTTNGDIGAFTGTVQSVEKGHDVFPGYPLRVTIGEKPGWKNSMARTWGIILIAMATMEWSFPGWNGIFFERRNITTGEAQIIAAVFFVGGLLLFFLGPRNTQDRTGS
jgi:hypothetical protein